MESTSENGRIQMTSMTHDLLKERFILQERDLIECKGLGPIQTSFLIGRK
jgi:adenylate cyclase